MLIEANVAWKTRNSSQMGRVIDLLTSSREISSLEKQRPGIKPRFLSQKIEQKEPEKKIPSTAAKATRRSAKVALRLSVQRKAHCALCITAGMVSMALKSWRKKGR